MVLNRARFMILLINLQNWFVINVGDDFSGCVATTRLISDVFCLPASYRRELPPKTSGGPINVFFKLPITEISNIDDHSREISLRLGYNMRWPEHRMVLNDSADWSRGEINVSPDIIKNFWVPDIVIHDLVRLNTPTVIQEVAAVEIVRDHSLHYKMRSEVTVVCRDMQFSRYPLDSHVCQFKLSSYGYDVKLMKINGRFSYDRESQRDLEFYTHIREIDLTRRIHVGDERNYSMYGVEILLTRVLTPYILSLYLPSSILVIIAWLSHLLPHPILRLSLQLIISMILLNMISVTRGNTPPANSITAVEIWLLGCLVILLVSILEVLFSSTLRPGRSNNIGQTGHETHSCCHLHDTSSMPIPMSSINSTSSSRANIVTGSEEFVQLVTPTSLQRKSCNTVLDDIQVIDQVEDVVQSGSLRREHLREHVRGVQLPDSRYQNYNNYNTHFKLIFPLIFCNFTAIYWIYFLHLT